MAPKYVVCPKFLLGIINARAITIYPFIFLSPYYRNHVRTKMHEEKHIEQQGAWFKVANIFGLLAWYFLYLLVLPVGYNYFRRKWETEALRAEGYSDGLIKIILREPPYYLR